MYLLQCQHKPHENHSCYILGYLQHTVPLRNNFEFLYVILVHTWPKLLHGGCAFGVSKFISIDSTLNHLSVRFNM